MTKEKRLKCAPPLMCYALDDRLNEENAWRSGFSAVVLTNIHTMKQRWIGIAYRTKSSDRGLCLNFCPWCGEKLYREGGIFLEDESPATSVSEEV